MKVIFLFLLLVIQTFGSIGNDRLAYSGVEFFISEEEERIGAYTLELKGIPYSYTYTTIKEDGKFYFPIFEFLKALKIQNYKYKNGILTINFGNGNDKRVIRLKSLDKSSYIFEDNDYYICENLFKEYFLERLRIDEENYILDARPNFVLPEEADYMLEAKIRELKEELNKEILYYEGERELFSVGNLRINLEQEITNNTGERREHDWSGSLEYSGSLFYGNFTMDYDLKEKKFGDFELNYAELKKDYELTLGVYGEDREKEITFRRNRGYSSDDGREYIIEERVPMGSRVELIYNLFPIDIQDEINGKVIFVNNLIKSGREFTLKIYEPSGKIWEKIIRINEDYNQQKKGEFGYDLSFGENKESKRNKADLNIYYGYTDNLTLGLSYRQRPEIFDDNWTYVKEMGTEFIYSNSIEGNPYTFTYEYSRGINRDVFEEKNLKHKEEHRFFLDMDIKDFNINYEQYVKGKYYEEKREIYIDVDYDLTENLSLTGSLEQTKYHIEQEDEVDYYYGLNYSRSWKSLLVSYEIETNRDNETRQNLDFYYTGFKNFTVRFENEWDENNDYEGEIKLNNTTWLDRYDVSLGMKYSEEDKAQYMLEFTLKLDNWFEIGTLLEKNGQKRTYAGIDRVISLKNPSQNMNSLENTTIKAVAFLDRNDNNKFDKNEERLSDVEVSLGEKKVITNDDGVAYIYGIPSYTDYEITALSRRPSHNGKATKIKVKGIGSSEVKAYIPIKPLITFMGEVKFEKDQSILSDTRIKLNKISTKETGKVIPIESNGEFYIDSLTAGKYMVEVEYLGEDYNVARYKKQIYLTYTDENAGDNYYLFELEEVKK